MVSIRRATLDDYEELSQVLEEVDALHRQNVPHVYREPEIFPPRSREVITDMIKNPETLLLVAEDEGCIVGVNIAEMKSALSDPINVPRRFIKVGPLVVKQTHQNRGIGKMLMERVYEWAREQGVQQIELGVFEFNQEAIAFYEKLGFRTRNRTMETSLEQGSVSAIKKY